MGMWKSLHDICRLWISKRTSVPNQATQRCAGTARPQHTHSCRELPTCSKVRLTNSSPTAMTTAEAKLPPWSLQRPPSTAVKSKPPSGHLLEGGIEVLQVRSIFGHCICMYTSVSVSLLKEGKVLPRSYELIRPKLPLFSSQGLAFLTTVSVLVVTALVYCIFFFFLNLDCSILLYRIHILNIMWGLFVCFFLST